MSVRFSGGRIDEEEGVTATSVATELVTTLGVCKIGCKTGEGDAFAAVDGAVTTTTLESFGVTVAVVLNTAPLANAANSEALADRTNFKLIRISTRAPLAKATN